MEMESEIHSLVHWRYGLALTEPEALEDRHGRRFQFLSVAELYSLAPPTWLVKPYLDAKSLAMIFGEPGTMKTFAALDLGLCLATGQPWHEHPVRQGSVFYIAGEGLTGLSRRIKAWGISRGISLETTPFFTSDRPAQILDGASAMEVVRAADELREVHGNPVLIIIDTLSRNFGPGDDNSTADMSRFISTVDENLRCRYQCAVLIVHHSGLTAKDRARGAGALRAALDWEYKMSGVGHGIRTLTNTKTKDYEFPPPISFMPEIITLDGWTDPDDGEVRTSCVLHRVEGMAQDNRRSLTGAKKIAFNALITAIEVSGKAAPLNMGGEGRKIVHIDTWRTVAYGAGISPTPTQAAKKKAFQRAVTDLRDGGWIETHNDFWWPKRDTGQGRDNGGTCPGTE